MLRKPLIIISLIFCFSRIVYAQNTFEKGYIITNKNEKIECLIQDKEWNFNPKSIYFKLDIYDSVQKGDLTNTKEFVIYENSKYIKANLPIDGSRNDNRELSHTKDPIFTNETLFLKVLLEGNISLYEKENGINSKYFYKKLNSDTISSLIYKKYLVDTYKVNENKTYIGEIYKITNGNIEDLNEIKKLKYEKEDLVKYIIKYHENNQFEYQLYDKLEPKSFIYNYLNYGVEIKNFNLHIGWENELNYNKRKRLWSVVVSPKISFPTFKTNTAYFDLPFLIRKYLNNENATKYFFEMSVVNFYNSFNFSSKKFFVDSELDFTIFQNLGYGVKFKNNIAKINLDYFTDFNNPFLLTVTFGHKLEK